MSKKLVLFTTLIFIVCVLLVSITVTFITKEMNSNNVITFGDIKIKSSVTTTKDNKEKSINDGDTFDITYNSNVDRNVRIENIGDHPAFIRVSFELFGKNKSDKVIDVESLVKINQIDDDWIYKDGWFYYKEALQSNVETNKLSVIFNFDIDKITEEYSGSSISLDINIEAVQSENNNKDVLNAEGWPTD